MKTATRDQIVQTAHHLFYAEGFASVGLDRILDEVGVTKTTFYNHFESKDDLVLATLRMHDEWWRGRFTALLRKHGGDDPRSQLLAMFDAIEEVLSEPGYNGCIFINVAVQFPNPNDPAHAAATEHKKTMLGIIRELASYAGAPDPASFAQQYIMALEGAYVSRQIDRAHNTADIGRRLALTIINAHIPEKR